MIHSLKNELHSGIYTFNTEKIFRADVCTSLGDGSYLKPSCTKKGGITRIHYADKDCTRQVYQYDYTPKELGKKVGSFKLHPWKKRARTRKTLLRQRSESEHLLVPVLVLVFQI